MPKSRTGKDKKNSSVFAGVFFIAGLIVLVLIGVSLGREAYRKRQIQKEIESLENEIQKTSRGNSELENLISYFSTSEFQEKEAREKLNLQKENERMIVLHKDAEQPEEKAAPEQYRASASAEDGSPNWQKWFKFFFEIK